MRIYTRTGDQGDTGLFGGQRVSKAHSRLEAYGTLDELNSVIGLLLMEISDDTRSAATLERIQHDLFLLGSRLATPSEQSSRLDAKLTRPLWPIAEMEASIDELGRLAPPMQNFVLPGGTSGAAHAHWARTLCRRAERCVVALHEQEPVAPEILIYLNRLSDWLFALARAENAVRGVPDVEWVP